MNVGIAGNRIRPKSKLLGAALIIAGLLDRGAASAQAPAPAPDPERSTVTAPAGTPLDTTESPPVSPIPPAEQPRARLDYSDGTFYLRAIDDNMVFVPSARMHVDLYSFAGPGVSEYHKSNGTGLKTSLFFRRFILEIGGLIRHKWFYWMGGTFGQQAIDGTQQPIATANVYDGFIGYMPIPKLRIFLGQYNAPFTMENVTSSRWMDLMERALTVRTLATPYNKADGLLVWGETENKAFEYQVGIFAGDGMNRPNIDNRFDGMGRFVVRPLAKRSDALRLFHLGVGARLGWRDPDFVQYDAPALSTPGGYTFWAPSYTTADGTKMHVITAGHQAAVAGELYLPFERWDVRGEFLYLNENRHEVAGTDRSTPLRGGALTGLSGYAQLSVWLWGTARISGNPAGVYGAIKLPKDLGAQAPFALQLVVRGEVMRVAYDGNARNGDSAGGLSSTTNDIKVNAFQLGLNYWATKHVRLTAEYSLYHFPGDASSNQAQAPGVASKAAPDANVLHEFSARVGLAI